jgi:PAS domain S-box-containing protein
MRQGNNVTELSERESIRGKLMRLVLISTAVAVLVAGLAMLTRDLTVNRQAWGEDLANQATIIGLATTPALAFDDHTAAERYLTALRGRPRILMAALYDADGRLYAYYVKDGEGLPASQVPAIEGIQINGQQVQLVQPIVRGAEILGSLYIKGQYDVASRVTAYIGIFGLVMALSLLVAYLLSKRLQRVITEPLDAIAAAARDIVERRDYESRARKYSNDEFGIVADAFNNMMDEVQTRSAAQERTNRELQREIEVRQAAEAALQVATARLESTMAAAEIGTWSWDIPGNHFTADRNLAALFGLGDERQLSGDPQVHRQQIHADDLPAVLEAEQAAMRTGVLASTEFRVIWSDGSEHWMARRGKVQMDAEGRPVFISGLLIDITAQKTAEQALRASEKLYRAIGESIDFGVWVVDRGGRSVYTSESFLKLVGKTQAQWAQSSWIDVLHPSEAAQTAEAWRRFLQSDGTWYQENQVLGVDGIYHSILSQGVAIRGEQNEITGFAGINLDISRLKATEEALREADRRKDEFLATLAHELRNPLTPIRHAVKLLDGNAAEESQQQWAREVIARQLQRMALMLDDLLEVSRITQGRLELKTEVVDLASLVSTAIETARPLIEAKEQHLSVTLPDPVSISVDPLRISQSISNLLTNASKYTDAGGNISLEAVLLPDEIAIRIKDDGIGLDEQAIPRLFEMFSQVKSAIDRSEGGLGIGLALVRGMIQLHGGSVEAASQGLGRGSQFTIHLPGSLLVGRSAHVDAHSTDSRTAPGARRTVLVVDDNRDAADTLAMLLDMDGYDTLVAHSGKDALETVQREQPNAVILDIGMPDLNGYEVAQRIRKETWGSGMFLLAITGWGHPDDVARAKAAGFNEHLTKPVDAETVVRMLTKYLAD